MNAEKVSKDSDGFSLVGVTPLVIMYKFAYLTPSSILCT